MSDNKFIVTIVAAGCGVALVVVVGVILSRNAKAQARQVEITALASELGELVSRSSEHIRNRDFERATSTLQAIEPSIVTVGDYSLQGQYDQAMARVVDAQRAYKARIRNGWEVFEGKFVSPDNKQRILADRKRMQEEELRQAEHERGSAEARQQKEAAERQLLEQKREAEERRKEHERQAAMASRETVKRACAYMSDQELADMIAVMEERKDEGYDEVTITGVVVLVCQTDDNPRVCGDCLREIYDWVHGR